MPNKKEQAQTVVQTTDGVSTKDELLADFAEAAPTEIVNKVLVRGLTGEEYQNLQGMRISAAQGADAQNTEAAFRKAEMLAFLTFGVIEPRLKKEEWQATMRTTPHQKLDAIMQAIQRLTGVGSFLQEVTKNVLRETELTGKNSG